MKADKWYKVEYDIKLSKDMSDEEFYDRFYKSLQAFGDCVAENQSCYLDIVKTSPKGDKGR